LEVIAGFSVFQVEKAISTQLALMKTDQRAASVEPSSSYSKTLSPSLANLPQPGPSGLSGRASKI